MGIHRKVAGVASQSLAMACLVATVTLHEAQPDERQRNGMVFVAAREATVGTSQLERTELAERFDCHPTWLNDDLPRRQVDVAAFWIDREPVTNAQYLLSSKQRAARGRRGGNDGAACFHATMQIILWPGSAALTLRPMRNGQASDCLVLRSGKRQSEGPNARFSAGEISGRDRSS